MALWPAFRANYSINWTQVICTLFWFDIVDKFFQARLNVKESAASDDCIFISTISCFRLAASELKIYLKKQQMLHKKNAK